MTATTTSVTRPAGGGPAPRWSPRRLGHHRYLWHQERVRSYGREFAVGASEPVADAWVGYPSGDPDDRPEDGW